MLESLHAEGGNQHGSSGITATGGLALKSVGRIDLDVAPNSVTAVAATVTTSQASLEFANTGNLQVGTGVAVGCAGRRCFQ